MRFALRASAPLIATLAWVVALIAEPGVYLPTSVLLVGLGLLGMTTIGTVGLVLVGAKWALRLLTLMLVATLLIAIARPVDLFSIVGLLLTGSALIALFAPASTRMVRKLPPASGPPGRAVVATLLGLSAPLILGLVPEQPNGWVVTLAALAPLGAFLYSRTIPGGLLAMRWIIPALGIVTALMMPLPHAIVAIVLSVSIGVIAWSTEVAVAFRPLIEKGTTYAIPPELAPSEILDGAGIDERGRPK